MLMNAIERAAVNNPLRTAMLRGTLRWLRHSADGRRRFAHVLEIGCGQGEGIRQIQAAFDARRIDAFDLDPAQVARASARLAAHPAGAAVRLWVGDAERIPVADGTYDAVFEFTILHHVPHWVRALDEIRRVLKPGGLFLFEELSRELFQDVPLLSPLLRRLTVHPWDVMFDRRAFQRGLVESGLRTTAFRTQRLPGWHRGVAVAQ
jgi:ubiquinone/menaquinone biosynthesis C-methylase UbiE